MKSSRIKQIAFLLFLVSIAGIQAEAKKIQGQIITASDTLNVLLNIPFKWTTGEPYYEKIQQKIVYFDASGKKIKMRPSEAREVRFTYGKETIRMLSVYNSLMMGSVFVSDPRIFLRLRIEGTLKLFTYYDTKSSGGMYNPGAGMMMGGYSYNREYNILQKKNEALMKPTWISFRKDMISYLSDCKELLPKLENRDLKSSDMAEIVRFYNSHCGSRQ